MLFMCYLILSIFVLRCLGVTGKNIIFDVLMISSNMTRLSWLCTWIVIVGEWV